jgi:hypothetical protein
MPNNCINELVFRDVDGETQARILAATCNAEALVDFKVLVPAPLNMWWGNVGQKHEATFKRTHLDWARNNWGTKWNAYGHHEIERTADTLTLRFETAWSPPYPWLAAVFNRLNLPFEHNWMEEGGTPPACGRFSIEPRFGQEWAERPADETMSRHLHKLLWGVEEFEEEDA